MFYIYGLVLYKKKIYEIIWKIQNISIKIQKIQHIKNLYETQTIIIINY